jgi:histone chaperone ASF1
MSAVNVTNVTVLDNPSMFLNPFQFEISYECLAPLKDGKDDINLSRITLIL